MSLEKLVLADAQKEIDSLENETKLLLETIRGKRRESSKGRVTKKLNSKEAPKVKLSKSIDGMKKLPLQPTAKSTIEVYDDASPDNTPRGVREYDNVGVTAIDKLNKSGQLEFFSEKQRVENNSDTFAPSLKLSTADLENEKFRLGRIEDSVRLKQLHLTNDKLSRATHFSEEKSVLIIQSLFRGFIGRKKVKVIRQIESLLFQKEIESDWIEVVDKDTGDKWYYNKATNQSQWNKPEILKNHKVKNNSQSVISSKSSEKALLKSSSSATKVRDNVGVEINNELGISKISSSAHLTAPDGKFKSELRNVVLDALLETRFDSVATVLADNRWYNKNEEILEQKQRAETDLATNTIKPDINKLPMVSVMKLQKESKKRLFDSMLHDRPNLENAIGGTQDLTLNEVEHHGFGDSSSSNVMCFGCWSAGLQNKCVLHSTGGKVNPSETMLLCRNWDISVMRRRYRAEEIQEIFVRRETSLRYDPKRRRFYTVIEQKHPIYRIHLKLLESFNNRMNIFLKVKYWLNSFSEEFHRGKLSGKSTDISKLLRLKQNMYNKAKVDRFTIVHKDFIPSAPVTGYTWPERIMEEQYLFNVVVNVVNEHCDIIQIKPLPVPKRLYAPREYPLKGSKVFPLSKTVTSQNDVANVALCGNKFIDTMNPSAWLEKLCSKFSLDIVESTTSQIKSFTPVTTGNISAKVKRPQPTTIKFITIGNKPTTGNMAVGGLPWEQLVYHIISTYYSPQYGNFMVMDKSVVSPGVSPEITIVFRSIIMPPTIELYVERPLEHPLTYRRSPTITLNSDVSPSNKFLYGINRSEQTGEQESHGFRTTTWAPKLHTFAEIDPQVFVPGQNIASLNVPKANSSFTTHADFTYPFCEPSTKDNSTLDFYHLLLSGVVSASKAQVFTALTVQEPGQFQKAYRTDVPMGHLVVSVYRSWAFTQQDTIQEFKTDDGVSYWYHRKTGQTFWERPLYEDEESSPLIGGTILDVEHIEEPMMLTKGAEGATRRYLQGEFRQQMLMHIETKKDAVNRRKAAAATVRNAKERGVIPSLPFYESLANNANDSLEIGSKMDCSKTQNYSLVPNSEPSRNDEVLSRIVEKENSLEIMQLYSQKDALMPIEENQIDIQQRGAVINAANNISSSSNGMDMGMFNQMAAALGDIVSRIGNTEQSTPQDILQLGLTMGMALMQAGSMQNIVDNQLSNQSTANQQNSSFVVTEGEFPNGFPSVSEEFTEDLRLKSPSRISSGNLYDSAKGADEPIGKPYPTAIFSSDKVLDHSEELKQRETLLSNKQRPLNTMEIARNLSIEAEIAPTPDTLPPKVLTHEKFSNAEDSLVQENLVPIVAYTEIASQYPGGALPSYLRKQIAGLGTSFVSAEEKHSQLKVPNNPHLTRNVLPLPVGFFEAIEAKHVAKQAVDYLPQVPNLPQSRTIGRVKPRSAASDWLMISFDPWSAGKNPLGTEYVPSLMAKADRLLGSGGGRSGEAIEALRQATVAGAFVHVQDEAGLAEQRAEITKAQVLSQDFKKLCSLCRHSKFSEAEQLINQPDWSVPIDYQDDQGNALIHVAAQNGSKRLVKLCLRRGASLNLQNLSGQSALHFAFGYGYSDVGEYLISKGADDSIRNKDGLTCYEGLGARELALL